MDHSDSSNATVETIRRANGVKDVVVEREQHPTTGRLQSSSMALEFLIAVVIALFLLVLSAEESSHSAVDAMWDKNLSSRATGTGNRHINDEALMEVCYEQTIKALAASTEQSQQQQQQYACTPATFCVAFYQSILDETMKESPSLPRSKTHVLETMVDAWDCLHLLQEEDLSSLSTLDELDTFATGFCRHMYIVLE